MHKLNFNSVIALSGLNGHAFGSFKQKGNDYMWLRDQLPTDIKTARILIYGYDTRMPSIQNIHDLGESLRSQLNLLCSKSRIDRPRPVVFIAHSLGGVIVKATMVKMAESTQNEEQANFQSICGALFFGVPSQGMNIASLVPMMHESARRALLNDLDSNANSVTLRDLGVRFPRAVQLLPSFTLFNGYETVLSPTALKVNGIWKMEGPEEYLVSIPSATQGKTYNEPGHEVLPINRTHSNLVKFSSATDVVYISIVSWLDRLHGSMKNIGKTFYISKDDKYACLRSLSFSEQNLREQDDAINPAKGTCNWILEHPNFRSWLKNSPGLLWVLGNPGTGKSTMMKFLALAKENRSLYDKRGLVVKFFVHGRGIPLQKTLTGLFRSLLHQILLRSPLHLSIITKKFMKNNRTRGEVGKDWKWSNQELRQFFLSILPDISSDFPVTIFVDALDELDETEAIKLIFEFKKVTAKTKNPLRICFSCRHYPNLPIYSQMRVLMQNGNSRDIEKVVDRSLESLSIADTDKATLTGPIIPGAKGSFMWVTIVLAQAEGMVRRGRNMQEIMKRIRDVPETLENLYASLLEAYPRDDRDQIVKLFHWALFSVRPLSLEELREAMATDPEMSYASISQFREKSQHYSRMEDFEAYITGISMGLVEVIKFESSRQIPNHDGRLPKNSVQFIHQSVPDYLVRDGFRTLEFGTFNDFASHGHFHLSRACIKYLFLQEINDCPLLFRDWRRKELKRLRTIVSPDRLRRLGLRFSPYSGISIPARSAKQFRYAYSSAFPLARYASNYWIIHVIGANYGGIPQTDLLELFSWSQPDSVLPQRFLPQIGSEAEDTVLKSEEHMIFANLVARYDDDTRGALDYWSETGPSSQSILTVEHAWKLCAWRRGKDPPKKHLVHILSLAGIANLLTTMQKKSQKIYELVDSDGFSPLTYGLVGNHADIARQILDTKRLLFWKRASLLGKDASAGSAIYTAAAMGLEKVVKILTKMSKNPRHTNIAMKGAIISNDKKALRIIERNQTTSSRNLDIHERLFEEVTEVVDQGSYFERARAEILRELRENGIEI